MDRIHVPAQVLKQCFESGCGGTVFVQSRIDIICCQRNCFSNVGIRIIVIHGSREVYAEIIENSNQPSPLFRASFVTDIFDLCRVSFRDVLLQFEITYLLLSIHQSPKARKVLENGPGLRWHVKIINVPKVMSQVRRMIVIRA